MGVSRSGYYTWKNEYQAREQRKQEQEDLVLRVHSQGEGHYGAARIAGIIRRDGGSIATYKVVDIMKKYNLSCSHHKRRQKSLTDSRKSRDDSYKNLTQDIIINKPMQVLSSDITYIRTGEGFDYLCQVKDVVTGVIVGYCQHEYSGSIQTPRSGSIQTAHSGLIWTVKT